MLANDNDQKWIGAMSKYLIISFVIHVLIIGVLTKYTIIIIRFLPHVPLSAGQSRVFTHCVPLNTVSRLAGLYPWSLNRVAVYVHRASRL